MISAEYLAAGHPETLILIEHYDDRNAQRREGETQNIFTLVTM
jgi:hypothetical protein